MPSLLLALGWGRAQQRGAGRVGRPTLGEPTCLLGAWIIWSAQTNNQTNNQIHLPERGSWDRTRGKWNVKSRSGPSRANRGVLDWRGATPVTTSDALKLVNEAEHVTITQLRSSSPAQPPRVLDGMRT